MYKKKLGVRVITAITVGALLSSNMSVAMANTQIASLEDNLDEAIIRNIDIWYFAEISDKCQIYYLMFMNYQITSRT